MLLSFDEVGQILDDIAETFPQVFYADLNGGILLLPEKKLDPEFPHEQLYIMGEYCKNQMGCYINLYYGSFRTMAALEDWTVEDWTEELYDTLSHEFTHHMEGLAGERGLEVQDAQFMDQFRREQEHE